MHILQLWHLSHAILVHIVERLGCLLGPILAAQRLRIVCLPSMDARRNQIVHVVIRWNCMIECLVDYVLRVHDDPTMFWRSRDCCMVSLSHPLLSHLRQGQIVDLIQCLLCSTTWTSFKQVLLKLLMLQCRWHSDHHFPSSTVFLQLHSYSRIHTVENCNWSWCRCCNNLVG